MPIASMTGFARAEGSHDGIGWAWEIKSVNGKSLDLRVRVPNGYDLLEPALRLEPELDAHRRQYRGRGLDQDHPGVGGVDGPERTL